MALTLPLQQERTVKCALFSCYNGRMRTRDLFATFLKIGGLTIGGGYAMIPVIEKELVDRKKWVEPTHFYHLIAIAQAIPGIIALNSAIYLGYKLKGIKGAVAAGFGVVLPSFMIMLAVAIGFVVSGPFPTWLNRFFEGVRVAVIALILVAAMRLFSHTNNPYRVVITAGVLAIMIFTTLHPFFIIASVIALTVLFTPKGAVHVD